ncbi:MAG: glycerol kinase [Chloroflexi bacterium]|nr:glycerol kinase [Chloroflexota bacterium]
MKNKRFFLAIDQGTTSTRSIIFNEKFKVLVTKRIQNKEFYPEPGWVEQDPNEILEAVINSINLSLDKINISFSEITCIGITNQRESIVCWDSITGKSLYNSISWQCLRGDTLCQKIRDTDFENYVNNVTGLKVDPYFSSTKISWILKNSPDVKKALKNDRLKLGTIDSWLMFNLLNNNPHLTDLSNASRTGLLNTKTLNWDKRILSYFDIPVKILPKIVPSNYNFGTTNKKILGSEVPITAVLGDQHASLYGHSSNNENEIKCTYGTGAFILLNTFNKRYSYQNDFLSTVAWEKDKEIYYALEGSVFSAGSIIEWLKNIGMIKNVQNLQFQHFSEKNNENLFFIPALNGLGAPFWNSKIKASIEGINFASNRESIIKAALESVAFSTKAVIDSISNKTKINFKTLKVDGGLTNNKFLMQFQADLLGIPILVSENTEMTCLGVARLASEKIMEKLEYDNDYKKYLPNKNNMTLLRDKYNIWMDKVRNNISIVEE